MKKGIDVSYFQGDIDWNSVEKDGIEFAILRTGYGTHTTDAKFAQNVERLKKTKIKTVGVYHFSYSLSVADALTEANYVLSILKKYVLPKDTIVFFDYEYESVNYALKKGVKINSKAVIDFTNVFCDVIKKAGYKYGVYMNGEFFYGYYDNGNSIPEGALLWYADWRTSPDSYAIKDAAFHQYSEKGSVSGINGSVDLDYMLIEDETEEPVINTDEPIEEAKTNGEIADEVIAGKWGNGDERKEKLTKAGYDYNIIQLIVNSKLKTPTIKPVTENIINEVIAGKWGNGDERKEKLTKAGYDYRKVQDAVNAAIAPRSKAVSPAKSYDEKYSSNYEVTASSLNMRYIPGNYSNNNVINILTKGTKVRCWGYYTIVDKKIWLYVQYGNKTGHVMLDYLTKK